MFAMTSGTTNRPKTIPVTRESLRDYREGWTIWGILAFDAHIEILRRGLKPILQLASDWRRVDHARGHPLRRDHRADGPHAEPPGPHHLLHAGRRPRGSRTSSRSITSRCGSRCYRDLGTDHRRQPQHDPGHRPAGRPREGRADPRPRRRHDRRPMADPARRPPRPAAPDVRSATAARRAARARSSSGPAGSAQGLLAQPRLPGQLDGRHDGGLSPGLSRVLRRDARSATSA